MKNEVCFRGIFHRAEPGIAGTALVRAINYTVYDRSNRHPERYRNVPLLRMSSCG